MWWGLFVLLIVFAGTASIIRTTLKNGISPMPTSAKVKKQFIQSLPNNLNGAIYELGAGWGTLAFPLAERYPQNPVIAIENSLIPYLFCKLRLFCCPVSNLKFVRENFFEITLKDTSLVVCYLFPGAMQKLKEKFEQELPPHAIIATHTFAIPGWQPIFTEKVNDLYHTVIYHYLLKNN